MISYHTSWHFLYTSSWDHYGGHDFAYLWSSLCNFWNTILHPSSWILVMAWRVCLNCLFSTVAHQCVSGLRLWPSVVMCADFIHCVMDFMCCACGLWYHAGWVNVCNLGAWMRTTRGCLIRPTHDQLCKIMTEGTKFHDGKKWISWRREWFMTGNFFMTRVWFHDGPKKDSLRNVQNHDGGNKISWRKNNGFHDGIMDFMTENFMTEK